MADSTTANHPVAIEELPPQPAESSLPKPPPNPHLSSNHRLGTCCPPTTATPDVGPGHPPLPTITISDRDETKRVGDKQTSSGWREKYKLNTSDPSDEAQPWIVQKLVIFILVGLWGLATYVYIGRICAPMIRKDHDALGSKTLGSIFLVVFCLLWVIFGWSYAKIVMTSPGYAKHHVSHTPPPFPDIHAGPAYTSSNVSSPAPSPRRSRRSGRRPSDVSDDDRSENNSVFPGASGFLHGGAQGHGPQRLEPPTPNTGRFGSVLRPPGSTVTGTSSNSLGLPPVLNSRQPPQHALLAEEHRYCHREGFIKPLRAHHCRMCGTCVLNYDHHCPWIGQCVGARNRKFFLIFVFWSLIFNLWIGTTLVIAIVRAGSRNQNIDALSIVIVALTGLFSIFTAGLLSSHIWMISMNLTTVEHYGIQNMERREELMLDQIFPWWRLRARRRTVKQWDEEWGALTTEGNVWWLGSRRANWEAVMGKKWLTWFLPIGNSESDGLTYPTNPRFDPEGRWRRRREWPVELRDSR